MMPILVLGTMDRPDSGTSAQLEATGVLGARIAPVVVSTRYRLGLALGAVIAGLSPLMYLALVVLAAWVVCSAAYRYGAVPGGTSNSYSPAGFLALLAGGCLLILSLLKPLVARPGRVAEPHFLDPDKEPLLMAFVRELAFGGGMPEPSRIAVDCSVNCCCIFAGGIGGLFRTGLVVQVGLPLVAGLHLDEFGGILAHELAHAAQTKAMWPSRFIRSVHAWFLRVAFEQDDLDEKLVNRLETGGPAAKLTLRLAQALFMVGRVVLRLLAVMEGAASSVFLRRMELEADRFQARVGGTDAFVSAVLEVNLLAFGSQRAVVELSRMKREGRLVDNYPGLIAALRGRYSEGFVQRVRTRIEQGKTGWFNTHPCDKDRIALARAEKTRGILKAGLPAAILFADYDALCRGVTLEFYDQELRLRREDCRLIPLQSFVSELD